MGCTGCGSGTRRTDFLPSPVNPGLPLSAPRIVSRNYFDNTGTDKRLEIEVQVRGFRCFRVMPARRVSISFWFLHAFPMPFAYPKHGR
jgi:hypothetical protein